jgi:hypothetical protein
MLSKTGRPSPFFSVSCLCLGKGVYFIRVAFLSTAALRRGASATPSNSPQPFQFVALSAGVSASASVRSAAPVWRRCSKCSIGRTENLMLDWGGPGLMNHQTQKRRSGKDASCPVTARPNLLAQVVAFERATLNLQFILPCGRLRVTAGEIWLQPGDHREPRVAPHRFIKCLGGGRSAGAASKSSRCCSATKASSNALAEYQVTFRRIVGSI